MKKMCVRVRKFIIISIKFIIITLRNHIQLKICHSTRRPTDLPSIEFRNSSLINLILKFRKRLQLMFVTIRIFRQIKIQIAKKVDKLLFRIT